MFVDNGRLTHQTKSISQEIEPKVYEYGFLKS